MLKKNKEINSLESLIPINKAVSGKNGTQKIFVEDVNFGGHSFYGSGKKTLKTKTVSLKTLFSENKLEKINILKMDCEGAEYDILFNAPAEVIKKIDNIVMEYHNIENHNVSEIIDFLKKNGFKVKQLSLSHNLGQLYASKV